MTPQETSKAIDFPLFIVGVGRSGTTLLSLMVDAHSQIAIPYESNFFVRFSRDLARFGDLAVMENRRAMVREILAQPTIARWDYAPGLDEINLERCGDFPSAIDEIYTRYARHCGKQCWGDKSPGYTADMDVINALFPNARFIHLIRDGRDVTVSTLKQGWWSISDFVTTLKGWRRDVLKARAFLRSLPANRWVELRYEDLVADPQPQLERICAMLTIPFEVPMLEAYRSSAREKVREMVDGEHRKLLNKPSKDNAYKWRKNVPEVDQAIAEQTVGDLLRELDYPQGRTKHPLVWLRRVYHFGIRLKRAVRRRRLQRKHGREKRPYLFHDGQHFQGKSR